jgi:hypothetical protein
MVKEIGYGGSGGLESRVSVLIPLHPRKPAACSISDASLHRDWPAPAPESLDAEVTFVEENYRPEENRMGCLSSSKAVGAIWAGFLLAGAMGLAAGGNQRL